MAKMGRPQKEIDVEQFEKLCALQCTIKEVASFFGCTEKTIEAWCKRTFRKTFYQTFEEKSGVGKISLRRAQFRLAETNATMAIWLGKQYLGQRDTIDVSADMADSTIEKIAKELFNESKLDNNESKSDN